MRKSRFTEVQIIGIIKKQEAGMPTAEVFRKHRLSQGTFYKFKSKYGGMEVSDAGAQGNDHESRLRQFSLLDQQPLPIGLFLIGTNERYFVYWRHLPNGDIKTVTVVHERMHQIDRFRDDFRLGE